MDYLSELDRRIAQFHRHLAPMDRRAHEGAHGPCFVIFEGATWTEVLVVITAKVSTWHIT